MGLFTRGGRYDFEDAAGIHRATKTVVRTIDVNAGDTSDSYQFDNTAANTTQQVITMTNLIPIWAEVLSCQVRCVETVTGSTAVAVSVGTSSGGSDLLVTANIDSANDALVTGKGVGPELSASDAARSVYFSATPAANWNTLSEGRWAFFMTYIDYSEAGQKEGV